MSIPGVMLATHSMSPALGGSEDGVGSGGKVGGCSEETGTFAWPKEQRGGCRDHAGEEKCPTVLDQAERRHLGAQISHPEPTWGTSEHQGASAAAALLFLFNSRPCVPKSVCRVWGHLEGSGEGNIGTCG